MSTSFKYTSDEHATSHVSWNIDYTVQETSARFLEEDIPMLDERIVRTQVRHCPEGFSAAGASA